MTEISLRFFLSTSFGLQTGISSNENKYIESIPEYSLSPKRMPTSISSLTKSTRRAEASIRTSISGCNALNLSRRGINHFYITDGAEVIVKGLLDQKLSPADTVHIPDPGFD